MAQLTNQDLFIIKQSQSWASRSISKFRSFSDKVYGATLRDILDKSVVIRDQTRDIWDDLVSGETTLDNKALNNVVGLSIIFQNIKATIIQLVVPQLMKEGVDIVGAFTEKEEEKPDNKRKGKSPAKEDSQEKATAIQTIRNAIVEIQSAGVDEDGKSEQTKILVMLNDYFEQIKKENNVERIQELYQIASNLYEEYSQKIKTKMADDVIAAGDAAKKEDEGEKTEKTSRVYAELIKNASTLKSSTYYYLVAMGKYGPISTPLKNTWKNIKQVIPFAGEPKDIYQYRKNAIIATKELIVFAKEFISEIQKAIATGDKLSKWTMIINKYNEFVDVYNSKLDFYSGMFDALMLKSRQDNMMKSKKKHKGVSDKDLELPDFSEYEWKTLPTSSKQKFKPLEKIRF